MDKINLDKNNEFDEEIDKEDLKLAMSAYDDLDREKLIDFETLCKECGIDYESL